MGMSQVPEGRRVFPDMTVLENLELGAYLRRDRAGIAEDLKMVYERFPRLADRQRQALCPAASSRCLPWAGR